MLRDFFDFIIIDESNWGGIPDYFAPAMPHQRWLPDAFRLKQIATTLDDYVFTLDHTVVEGEIEAGKRYQEADFNRIIEIREREK